MQIPRRLSVTPGAGDQSENAKTQRNERFPFKPKTIGSVRFANRVMRARAQ